MHSLHCTRKYKCTSIRRRQKTSEQCQKLNIIYFCGTSRPADGYYDITIEHTHVHTHTYIYMGLEMGFNPKTIIYAQQHVNVTWIQIMSMCVQ